LIDKINVGGKMTDVVYQFQRTKNTNLKYKKDNYEKFSILALV
jgi:hypothetical protein